MTAIENAQIKALTQQIEEQNVQIIAKNSHIMDVKQSVERIEEVLIGGKFNKTGMIERMEHAEVKLDDLNKIISKFQYKWAGAVWILAAIASMLGIIYYLSSIFHNLK